MSIFMSRTSLGLFSVNKMEIHGDMIISTCSDAILDRIIQFLSVAAELIDVISDNVIIVPGNLSNAL